MATYTNYYQLPETIYSALASDRYVKHGHMSVTELINPPRLVELQRRYNSQIVEDVSDRIWLLLGNAVHDVLERANTVDCLQEERLSTTILGWSITGKADLYTNSGTIVDYKVTSTYAIINGLKPEWIKQVSLYAYLFNQAGFSVNHGQIVAILRDWSRGKAKQGGDYPPCAVSVLDVPIWRDSQVEQYLHDRIALHQQAEELDEADLPDCTPEERWEKPTQHAVMKKGRKSAVRVLDDLKAAEQMVAEKGAGHYVETRPGKSVRCEDFCPVRPWCSVARV